VLDFKCSGYYVTKEVLKKKLTSTFLGEQGSSVSIVSGYEQDDRAIEVRSPAEAK
jgi:hypothetical protein